MRQLVVEMQPRGGFLQSAPWRVSGARDPAQAAICAQQLRDAHPDALSPLAQYQREALLPDLEAASVV